MKEENRSKTDLAFEKFKDDPKWSGNHKGGLGGTHYFQWMKKNDIVYTSYFEPTWELFIKEFPEDDTDAKFLIAGELHMHYYECGH